MTDSAGLSGRASETKLVLVTGATGKQGGALGRLLLRRGHRVRAFTRKPDGPAAGDLKKLGAEVVAGDLGDRASIERAAKGVDVAYIVATPYEQGPAAEGRFAKTALDAARAAGVPYLVYSSVSDADRKTGIPHFDSKFEVEEHLKGLGVEYSIVAPVFFSDNLFSPWMAGGLSKGVLATGVLPDRRLQSISVPEIAEFTALAIENPRTFRGKRTNIASDELTPVEMARSIAEAAHAKVTYVPIPIAQVRQQSEDTAKMYDWFNRVGYSVDIARLKREHPQVHWRSFREWAAAQDWSPVFSSSAQAPP
jgi:uncharacterized protein YbjT (DUF2867 family)